MDVIRGLTTGDDYFEFHGDFCDIRPIKMTPVPTEPIPLLGRRSRRRGAATCRRSG